MRVLLTSTDNPYTTKLGGKHIHLLLLERGLKNLGLQVTALYCDQQSLMMRMRKLILKCLPAEAGYRRKIRLLVDCLEKHVPEASFDIVHAHDVLSLLALRSVPQKKVLTLHGYFARENIEFIKSEENRKRIYPFLFEIEKEGMKNADYVITVDQRLREYVLSEFSFPPDKVAVLHNAIDTERFKPVSESERDRLKENMGYDSTRFLVLVPRRLVEKNGVIYAVRAVRNVLDGRVELVIVGDGPERASIEREAAGDERVRFVGAVPHDLMDSYYHMADVVLIPSVTSHGIQEATSLAMLEAMACGKAVICSNIGGMKEIIRHMQDGVLVQEKDAAAIARAIETLVNDQSLTGRLGRNAAQYVAENHSYTTHAAKVAQIYHTVLGK